MVVLSKAHSWDKHIQFVHRKAAKGITLLCRLLWFLPRLALCSLYGAYMLPHLCYADAVWSTYTKTQISNLEHRQNYAAHFILCRCRDAATLNMQKNLDWLTLTSMRAVSGAMVMSLSVSGYGPSYWTDLFQPAASTHLHGTRFTSSGGICLLEVRTEMGKKSLRKGEHTGGILFHQA